MDTTVTRSAAELSREELHELVWRTPMTKLGPQFGTDGPGFAALCRKRRVPTPPPGYWSKLAVGRAPPVMPLPPADPPAEPASPSRAPARARSHIVKPLLVPSVSTEVRPDPERPGAAEDDDGLDSMRSLHPKVKAWVAEHRQEQETRREENRRHRHDPWSWRSDPLPDLTQRDRYRFRATSTLFHAVEEKGGKVGEAALVGKVTFLVAGQKLATTIAEKMMKPLKRLEGAATWTAYPHNHQTGLVSSGFLRVKFETYVGGRSREWIETPKRRMAALLPDFVAAILEAGPILAEQAREAEERHRRYQQEQAERYERQRRQEIDDKRWSRFQKRAERWDERAKLLGFIAELRRRLEVEGDAPVEDWPLSEWIAWAEERAHALDPFRQGLRGLFQEVTKPEW